MLECPDCDRQMNRSFFYSHENKDIFVEFWCVCGARFEGHAYRVEKNTRRSKERENEITEESMDDY